MNKEYIHHVVGTPITLLSDNIKIEGHRGRWYVVNEDFHGRKLFELEHESYGDEAAHIIVNENGAIVLDDVWNSFDDYYESL